MGGQVNVLRLACYWLCDWCGRYGYLRSRREAAVNPAELLAGDSAAWAVCGQYLAHNRSRINSAFQDDFDELIPQVILYCANRYNPERGTFNNFLLLVMQSRLRNRMKQVRAKRVILANFADKAIIHRGRRVRHVRFDTDEL
jgi:hypothetical protein